MNLIGNVVKMGVDSDGKASGAFLRARVAMEIDKPLRRGVLLRLNRMEEPRWFQVQYESLPYHCFAGGIIGHSEMDCNSPVARDEHGKLPYDVQLRAPEEKKKHLMSFAGAAAESWGSGSFSASKPPRSRFSKSGDTRSSNGDDESHHSSGSAREMDDQEVQSPLKNHPVQGGGERTGQGVNRSLNMEVDEQDRQQRKRKSKPSSHAMHTPDLNEPAASNAIIPAGLVNSRVNQLDSGSESSGGGKEDNLKKQRRGSLTHNAGSVAAVRGSPRRAQ